jgi:hypothetical protein
MAGEHHGNQRSCGSPTLRTETTVGGVDDRSAYTVRGYNAERGAPIYVKLPNEANFLECWTVWIGLRDKMLVVQVCHFVTWLCFAGNGFVLPVWVGDSV